MQVEAQRSISKHRAEARRSAPVTSGRIETEKTSASSQRRSAKKKKQKRKKARKQSSSSSSTDTTETSDGSRSDSDSESSSTSRSESGSGTGSGEESGSKRRKRKKKEKEQGSAGNWEIMSKVWPMETRPAHLRVKKVVEKTSLSRLIKLKELYEKEAEKKGVGAAIFGLDEKISTVSYKAKKDNGKDKLHPARWERLPLSEPRKYWRKVPKKREEIFRHLNLSHYGAEGLINEATLVRLHDRQVPVELNMLHAANFTRSSKGAGEQKEEWTDPAEVRQLQEAVLNYTVVMQVLWPFDYGPLVITRVLVESRWGEAAGDNDKERVRLVTR